MKNSQPTDIWCLDKRTGKIRKADPSLGDGFLITQEERGRGQIVVINNGMTYPVLPSEFGDIMRPEHCPHGGKNAYHGECCYDPLSCDNCPMQNWNKNTVNTIFGDIFAAFYASAAPNERPPMTKTEIK